MTSRLVGLGDVVIGNGEHSVTALSGGELGAHYWPADVVVELPPVD